MTEAVRDDTPDEMLLVLLRGGPYGEPTPLRVTRQAAAEGKIKIARDGGYDHFERVVSDPPHDAVAPGSATFVWTTRTRVAE